MPYKIFKEGSKYVVRKNRLGRSFGKHDTKEKAQAQIRAIEANEHD
jgi:hypothetical protein